MALAAVVVVAVAVTPIVVATVVSLFAAADVVVAG